QRHGATTVRIDVSWRMLQPTGPGAFDAWGARQVDAAINAAADRGLRPLVTLWMSPQWATGSADERTPPTTSGALAAWQDFTQAMVERYGDRVDSWEIWNEPNHNDFMRGASPRAYAKVLRSANAGIKAADPSATVVFGGTQYVDVSWIRKVFAAGGTTYDVMGVHPYQGVADEAPELPDNGSMYRLGRVPALYSLMSKKGHAGRPIWFTEFGWRASP
ncbi:MAG: cellulase family glycosylhydrolase, partial [Actinobacteria bacterium]|nr:cellulase family glycosylhydrolase [Actinomycetota bacterium]